VAGALLVLVLPLRPPGAGVQHGAAARGSAGLDELRQALEREVQARQELAGELDFLREMLGELSSLPGASSQAPAGGTAQAEQGPQEGGSAESAAEQPAGPAFDRDALVAAGMSPEDADRLHERWSRYQLEQLDLNDRAMREGWFFTPRHRRERQRLEQALREDLGEDGYDAYLYATGAPNRVVVRDVLPGSAARRVGLRPGDVVLRYDDQRIFRPREVQRATAAGVRGQSVRLEILRDGAPRTFFVPRGPLGVLLETDSRPPA